MSAPSTDRPIDVVTARKVLYATGPAHQAFGQSRAAYFVVPRRTLQSMPAEWQERFIGLIAEARTYLPVDAFPQYQVTRLNDGRYAADPHRRYRRAGPIPPRPAGAAAEPTPAPLGGAFVNTDVDF
ncbi:hypothetical protein FJU31_04185 [Stenotrophomonas cyclobalanopsidis]|uniref:Uncharacterized protein n=1 Tax=Stenotrophomonas cyclobalanopsidis TaxID=2771362 RepID=A0ABQ6T4E5_9GAMM|nr:hypothetical protein [Stenotrophomonas cyclobalanopsidis]KAA9003509.1 hypothetical protein FJU31_04185 [Stenotrophomonas cyclobalanopsidis]